MKRLLALGLLAIASLATDAALVYAPFPLHFLHPSMPLSPLVMDVRQGFAVRHHRPDHFGTSEDEDQPKTEFNNYKPIQLMPAEEQSGIYLESAPLFMTLPTSSQFHQQDGLGQYQYGYTNPLGAKHEMKTNDGTTRGAYSYIDGNGLWQTVRYISDNGGFRVAATNLPKSPEPHFIPDSPEVAAEIRKHFRAHQLAMDISSNAQRSEDNGDGNEGEATSADDGHHASRPSRSAI